VLCWRSRCWRWLNAGVACESALQGWGESRSRGCSVCAAGALILLTARVWGADGAERLKCSVRETAFQIQRSAARPRSSARTPLGAGIAQRGVRFLTGGGGAGVQATVG